MSLKGNILVVDDEPNIRRILQVSLEREGFKIFVAENGAMALKALEDNEIQAVLSDVTMPGMTGYELLQAIKRSRPSTPVILMTAFGTIPQAVQAMRDGAFEYIPKPFDLDTVKRVVASALREDGESRPKTAKSSSKKPSSSKIIAVSDAMTEVLETAQQVADSRATVMIGGESGVGKEVVAKLIHESSSRRQNPFVAVSCAALPESLMESELFGHMKGAFTGADAAKAGRFESADLGTLFLDEIGEVPLQIQVKLLRVLQERQIERLGSSQPTAVDVRVITATHRDLQLAVEQGSFRLDLLYRLQVVELVIPPLRERVADIRPLAEHFLEKYCQENSRSAMQLEPATLQKLEQYGWPGNVRELENCMERAVVLSAPDADSVSPLLLPRQLRSAA